MKLERRTSIGAEIVRPRCLIRYWSASSRPCLASCTEWSETLRWMTKVYGVPASGSCLPVKTNSYAGTTAAATRKKTARALVFR